MDDPLVNPCANCGHGFMYHKYQAKCSMPGCDCEEWMPRERRRP